MSETTLEHWGCKNAPNIFKGDDIVSMVLYKGRVTQVICPHLDADTLNCKSANGCGQCYFSRGYLPTIYNGIIEQGEENQ